MSLGGSDLANFARTSAGTATGMAADDGLGGDGMATQFGSAPPPPPPPPPPGDFLLWKSGANVMLWKTGDNAIVYQEV